MGKGKKRPWIQAKIAQAEGGGGDASVLAEAEARKKRKAADRAARERAFKEQNPTRFEDECEEDNGGDEGGRADANVGGDARGGGGADWSGDGYDGRGGGSGDWSGNGNLPGPPGGYNKPPRDRPPPLLWRDDERTDVTTVPDVKKWMRSKEAQLPDNIKEQRRSKAEAITRQIATCAQHKQLGKAVNHYRRLVNHERLIPTSYTYASLINAYVNSGDMRGADEILKRMKAVPGMSPNVVVYTTMLKGHMLSGDVEKAELLINEMPNRKPPIKLDARAVNTFLRVCQRAGDAPKAWRAYTKIKGNIYGNKSEENSNGVNNAINNASNASWLSVVPDDATYKLVARLLSQSLDVTNLKDVIKHAKTQASHDQIKRRQSGGDASSALCQFWNAGKCDRGHECVFFHDPGKTQRADVENLDAVASMHVNLAHCCALLDDPDTANTSIATANDALDEAEALAAKIGEEAEVETVGDGETTQIPVDSKAATLATALLDSKQTATYKRTTRAELRLELKRVGGFLKRVRKGSQEKPVVAEYLTRALVFDSRVEVGDDNPDTCDTDTLVQTLHQRLCDAYGLERACGVSSKVTKYSAKHHLTRVLTNDGKVDFAALFGTQDDATAEPPVATEAKEVDENKSSKKSKKEKMDKKDRKDMDGDEKSKTENKNTRPVKLEICAGNGDWAVAQARADSESDWVALELRHDRVYSIFSRAVCEGANNLCAMGGDAASVLRKNISPKSVAHVFVNFPEPPHHSGDSAAVNEFHLLTPSFFRKVHNVLDDEGRLTLFSDNHRYMRDLAKTLAELVYNEDHEQAGEPLFSAEAAKPKDLPESTSNDKTNWFENIHGVRLYKGVPGDGTGHLVHEQSYFDRFWEQGARVERFFLVVSKN